MENLSKNTKSITLILISILLFLLTNLVWFKTTSFWFTNVDLGYMNQYFGFMQKGQEVSGISLQQLVRGHMLLQYPIYKLFEFNAFPYYLAANVLHGFTVIALFFICNNLFKDKKLSFFLSLVYGINITYSNVFFEGSFNIYYPLILLSILLSIITIQKVNKYSLILSVNSVFLVLSLLFRESGILIIPISSLYLFIFSKLRLSAKVVYIALLSLIFLIYLIIRNKLLGTLSSDLTDDAVQVRMGLISSGRFLEYFFLILLNLFRSSIEQVISYPVLYSFRDFVDKSLVSFTLIKFQIATVFILTLGILLYSSLIRFSLSVYKATIERNKKNIFFFSLCCWILINIFMAVVLPFPTDVLSRTYNYSTVLSRYNYFAFPFLVLLIGSTYLILIRHFYKNTVIKRLIFVLAILYLVYQAFLIQKASSFLYLSKHIQARNFFQQIYRSYPSFPDKAYIYYNYFQVDNLRDYTYDLTTIFGPRKYPNTKFEVQANLSNIQKLYNEHKLNIDQLYAFDLNYGGYLEDKTKKLRESLLLNAKREIALNVQVGSIQKNKVEIDLSDKNLDSNLSYVLRFNLQGDILNELKVCPDNKSEIDVNKVKALNFYNANLREFYQNAKVIYTSSDYGKGDPRFTFYKPDNLIDGQIAKSSSWRSEISDLQPIIILDLGQSIKSTGIGFVFSEGGTLPESYQVYTSNDQQNWLKVVDVKNNKRNSRIDAFVESQDSRFIKVVILSTALGQQAEIQELEVLSYSEDILKGYKSLVTLKKDNLDRYCNLSESHITGLITSNWQWGSVSSIGSKGTENHYQLPLTFDGDLHHYVVPILNYEIYSKSKYLLEEKISKIIIDFGELNVDMVINDIRINSSN